MTINGVEHVPIPPAVRDAHLENFDAFARDAPDMIEVAARIAATITGAKASALADRAVAAAEPMSDKKERRFRKTITRAVERAREEYYRGYVAQQLDAAANQADIDEQARLHGNRVLGKRQWEASQRVDEAAEPYVDIAALGDDVTPPVASAGVVRDDGVFTLVSREWNAHNGHPGAFKSGLAALHAFETLKRGGRVQWYDVDGNTPHAVVSRLLSAGVARDVLNDPERFRLTISASQDVLLSTVADAAKWLSDNDLVVMDAAGGLVAAFGGDSNSADDWMGIYQSMLAPLVATGAAGLLVDHFSKTAAGTGYATGTGAKLKSLHGIVYSVESWKNEPPRPNSVGKVSLKLVKDTHGATGYGVGDLVAVLELDSRDPANGPWSWRLMPGKSSEERESGAAEQAKADVDFILTLDPFPTSRDKLQAAIKARQDKGWSNDRASKALAAAKERREAATVTFNPTTNERTKKD